MKTSAILAIASLIAAAAGIHGSCLAGEKTAAGPRSIISVLAGSAVPTAELNSQHARGSTNIKVDAATASGGNGSSFDNGLVHGNAVIGTSATGTITTTNRSTTTWASPRCSRTPATTRCFSRALRST